jgi:hypothetical protein
MPKFALTLLLLALPSQRAGLSTRSSRSGPLTEIEGFAQSAWSAPSQAGLRVLDGKGATGLRDLAA